MEFLKYLVLHNDCRLKYNYHINQVLKVLKKYNFLFNAKLLRIIYIPFVQSIVTYCIKIWGEAYLE